MTYIVSGVVKKKADNEWTHIKSVLSPTNDYNIIRKNLEKDFKYYIFMVRGLR